MLNVNYTSFKEFQRCEQQYSQTVSCCKLKALSIIFKNTNYIYHFTNQYNVEESVLQLICTSVQKCAQKDIYWCTTGNTKYWGKNHTFISGEIMIVAHSCNRINKITKVVLDILLNEKTNQSI